MSEHSLGPSVPLAILATGSVEQDPDEAMTYWVKGHNP
jgi:hypothetical protein